MLERDIHRFDYPNAWQPNNANGGTDYGEFPVIATLSHSQTNTIILGGDRSFGNAGGARNNFNFTAGADTIT